MPLMFDLNEIIFWKTCTTHQKVLERTKCKMKNEFWVEKKTHSKYFAGALRYNGTLHSDTCREGTL